MRELDAYILTYSGKDGDWVSGLRSPWADTSSVCPMLYLIHSGDSSLNASTHPGRYSKPNFHCREETRGS